MSVAMKIVAVYTAFRSYRRPLGSEIGLAHARFVFNRLTAPLKMRWGLFGGLPFEFPLSSFLY